MALKAPCRVLVTENSFETLLSKCERGLKAIFDIGVSFYRKITHVIESFGRNLGSCENFSCRDPNCATL